jgi:hypothetical protein
MLLICEDDHGQLNVTNFKKWVAKKLIPNHVSWSGIVLDHAPAVIVTLRSKSKYSIMAVQEVCC